MGREQAGTCLPSTYCGHGPLRAECANCLAGYDAGGRAVDVVPFEKRHRDGSLWAKGQTLDGLPTGYWEWFRLDGTKLRSGHFVKGEQVGKWTTYDRAGQPYKVTQMKLSPPSGD